MPEATTAPTVRASSLAWDVDGTPERGPAFQPWRAYWPPPADLALSDEEKRAKPWLTWKRDAARLNDKPWYSWVNLFEGEVDQPCNKDRKGGCDHCGGQGCTICSTVAEGG